MSLHLLAALLAAGSSGGGGALLADGLAGTPIVLMGPRLLRTGYSGHSVVVTRSSDSTAETFDFVGDNLNTSGISTFIGGSTGFFQQYNQAAASNWVPTDTSGLPYLPTGINGHPAIENNDGESGGGVYYTSTPTGVPGPGGTQAIVSVVVTALGTTNYGALFGFLGTGDSLGSNCYGSPASFMVDRLSGNFRIARNEVAASGAMTIGTPVVFSAILDGTNMTAYVNGTQTGQIGNTGTFATTGQFVFGEDPSGTSRSENYFGDFVVVTGSNAGDLAQIVANQKAFYGIS